MDLVVQLLLGAAAMVAIWFMVRGLIDMQRVNTADVQVMEVQGLVRQLTPHGRFDMLAVLTVCVDDEVSHVDCILPGPWLGKSAYRVTDLVPILWRKGEPRAIAVQTIRDGQRMFLIGIAALTLSAVLYILLF